MTTHFTQTLASTDSQAYSLCLALSLAVLAQATPNPGPDKSAAPPTSLSSPTTPAALPATAGWEITHPGPHHRLWRAQAPSEPDPTFIPTTPRSFVELGAGLNRWDPAQQRWIPARAEFERTPDGYYVALHTQHQILLPPNLNVVGAVDLLTPDHQRLRSTILGLALVDSRSGRSVLLAEIQSCRPQQISPTEVLYQDAFDGILADVRYLVALDRFEQDVILRERVPPDVISAAGLTPESTRLLVLTEFFAPPKPAKRSRDLLLPLGDKMGDQEIRFGAMAVAAGQAFHTDATTTTLPVTKSWETLEGRQFLIESIHYPSLLPLLQSLPHSPQTRLDSLKERLRRTASAQNPATPPPHNAWAAVTPPPRLPTSPRHDLARPTSLRQTARFARDLRPASPDARPAYLADGVVIDYPLTLSTGTNDFTFLANTTYCITSPFSIGGTTTFEGGTVIKLATTNNPGILCYGPVRCLTRPFLPAIFTSIHDNAIGEILPGSANNPGLEFQGNPALQIMVPGQHLHDLRIAHAHRALLFHEYSTGANTLSHAQFVHCLQALGVNGYGASYQNLSLRNLLFYNITTVIAGSSFTASGQHITCCNCPTLALDPQGHTFGTTSTLSLLNSLLVATGDSGNVVLAQDHCASAPLPDQTLQSFGAAACYLANPALRDAGSPAIDPLLATELRTKTTWPPHPRSGLLPSLISTPQAPRDADPPDIGYHYDPIDEALDACTLANGASWLFAPGTAVATFGPAAIRLEENSRLLANGDPANPVRFFPYALVQEQSTNCSGSGAYPFAISGPSQTLTNTANAPTAEFRFTEFLAPAGPLCHLRSTPLTSQLRTASLRHCTVAGGELRLAGTTNSSFDLGNSLFSRAILSLGAYPSLDLWNCLIRGGSLTCNRPPISNPWLVRDCVFDNTTLSDLNGGIANSHNAYVGAAQSQLRNAANPTFILPTLNYAQGPFGPFYIAGTNLTDCGSRLASAAGLFHFTTSTNNTPEANTKLNLGLHYPVAQPTTNNLIPLPKDSDRDGIPDIAEDANGNGILNSGETLWNDPSDSGLQIQITRPSSALSPQ